MRITSRQLRQIIREELSRNMNESDYARFAYDASDPRLSRRERSAAGQAALDAQRAPPFKPYKYETPAGVARGAERDARDAARARDFDRQTIWDKSALELGEDEYNARRDMWLDSDWAGKWKNMTVSGPMSGGDFPIGTFFSSGMWRAEDDSPDVVDAMRSILDSDGYDPASIRALVGLWTAREGSEYALSYDDAVYREEGRLGLR